VVLDILRNERTFALAALLASIGFAATLTLLNVDGFIVRQNVARAAAGADLDVAYLVSLSSDSVPALVEAFQDGKLTPPNREAVGAALACRVYIERRQNPEMNWRGFTFSRWWADQALRQVHSRLDAYQILQSDWAVQVLTPGSSTYDCYQPGMGS
jgi:hypothetical protein